MKTFRIFTLGCKVNQYDSQSIREKLRAAGMREVSGSRKPDFCVINTCTVTGKADKESLYQVRRCRRDFPLSRIVVTGCVPSEGAKVEGADLLVTNADKPEIVRLMAGRFPGSLRAKDVSTEESISSFEGHTRAFLKIQDGCDNFCSYCKVPFVRGKPLSKPLRAIACEAAQLASRGYKEIVLTGICLGSYGKDLSPKLELADAVEALEPIKELARIRLSSIEAMQVTPRLIRLLKAGGKLCPHLHIPLQSGDDSVLRSMNRPYTSRWFIALVKKLNKTIPDFALTTDVMVGFPGETEENFRNTLKTVRQLGPLKVHIFRFSPRPGTRASLMKEVVR